MYFSPDIFVEICHNIIKHYRYERYRNSIGQPMAIAVKFTVNFTASRGKSTSSGGCKPNKERQKLIQKIIRILIDKLHRTKENSLPREAIFFVYHRDYCAAVTILSNFSGTRDAPPIRPPSTLYLPRSSAALPSFMLPPYWMVTASATSFP